MRTVVAAISVALVLLAAAASSAGVARSTSLRVAYWDDGAVTAPTEVWTLRCNPAGGTLPRPGRACRKLAAGGPKVFAPIPPSTVCTQIWGGPQKARVVGRLAGKRIWSTFTRSDGCQIARWNALSPWLLPPGGVTR